MNVTVIIPHSHGLSPERYAALLTVRSLFQNELKGWVDCRPSADVKGEFSRGRAINWGARAAPPGILLFNDADTLTPPAQIFEAVRLAADAPGLVQAYTTYRRLGKDQTAQVTEAGDYEAPFDTEWARYEWEGENTPSHSCTAISRRSFLELGGYNEAYVGWGYEDCDLTARATARGWPNRRVSGPLVHLWHGDRRSDDSPLSEDPALVAANLKRYRSSVAELSRAGYNKL